MSEPFMTITPRNSDYIGANVTGIQIKVIQDDGIEYNPHIKFSEVEMENGVKKFFNNSGKSDSFTISCLFDSTETVRLAKKLLWGDGTDIIERVGDWQVVHAERINGEITEFVEKDVLVVDMLDAFIRRGELFYITTRANGINDKDLWIITENKERTQSYDDEYTVWDLTFTKYVSFSYAKFSEEATGVTSAKKKYEKAKEKKAKAKALAKQKTTAKYKLKHECKASNLKYSKKKKVVTCVKYMQQILINKKCLKKEQKDGWYGKTTKNALKTFQRKYKEKYKCKTDGNVDKNTFKALCEV